MKREAQQHPKVTRLARELKVWPVTASGIVANLWLQTATHAHRGDIGRWPNWQIAEAIGYPGDPDELVRALIACRLLDEIPEVEGRLYVHDWHDHAEDWVHLRLARNRERFANGSIPRLTRMSTRARAEIEAAYASESESADVQPCADSSAHERTYAHKSAYMRTTQDPRPKTLDPRPSTKEKERRARSSNAEQPAGGLLEEDNAPPASGVADGPTKRSAQRATRIPADFELTEGRKQIWIDEGLPPDRAERAFAEFRDYWQALPGAKATKLDWEATWRNRCRAIADRAPAVAARPGAPPGRRPMSGVAANNQAVLEEILTRGPREPSSGRERRVLPEARAEVAHG